jgi:anti-sigma B factor antagonist
MRITRRNIGGVTILDLAGKLVLGDGDLLLRQHVNELAAHGRLQIVLNLHDVTYIDSAGVGMMVAKYLTVRRAGGDLRLLHLGARSRHVMTITRLTSVFETFESEQAAVASFGRERG